MISLKGVQNLPGDKEIFSWWGGAGNIFFMFHVVDDLIVNLWTHFQKSINFIERFGVITRRPRDYLLVGWGWEYLFYVSCSLWFDCKSMKNLSKIFQLHWKVWRIHQETRRFSLGGVGLRIFIFLNWFSIGDQNSFLMLWLEIYEKIN